MRRPALDLVLVIAACGAEPSPEAPRSAAPPSETPPPATPPSPEPSAPEPAPQTLDIEVVASAGGWTATYPQLGGATLRGGTEAARTPLLVLPIGRPVNLRLRAEDERHSFYVPALRAKQDFAPGDERRMELEARGGEATWACTEHPDRATERGAIEIVDPSQMDATLGRLAPRGGAATGGRSSCTVSVFMDEGGTARAEAEGDAPADVAATARQLACAKLGPAVVAVCDDESRIRVTSLSLSATSSGGTTRRRATVELVAGIELVGSAYSDDPSKACAEAHAVACLGRDASCKRLVPRVVEHLDAEGRAIDHGAPTSAAELPSLRPGG